MISHSGPAACSQIQQPVAHNWGRVSVTAAVRLCLFVVTLQWSTQLSSAARLTAERHRVTLILYQIQHGCFPLLPLLLPLLLPPVRYHPHAPPNSALLWLPIKCSSPAACSMQHASFPTPSPFSIFVLLTNIQLCISHNVNKFSDRHIHINCLPNSSIVLNCTKSDVPSFIVLLRTFLQWNTRSWRENIN